MEILSSLGRVKGQAAKQVRFPDLLEEFLGEAAGSPCTAVLCVCTSG